MKHVLLDTNFILSCIRKKIDFFEEIPLIGLSIIIPKQVIEEIQGISNSKPEAELALKILAKNVFKNVTLHGNNVDNGIVNLAKENKNYIIATLDKGIQGKIKNQKLIIRGEKKLEIV